MNKFKKLLVLFLASTMVLSMTGCKEKTVSDPASAPAAEPTTAVVADSGTEEPEVEKIEEVVNEEPFSNYPAFDMGGRTIKIAMFYDMYYDSRHTKPEDNPNVVNVDFGQKLLDNVRRVEDKYNVKIEYVNIGGDALVSSLNTSVVAGTPDYDVYLTQMHFALPLAVNGYFEDISDISKEYSDINNDRNIVTPLNVAGTNNFIAKSGKNVAGTYLVYNSDMLNQLGLEDPNELYKKGEWTWEKFEELCIASNQDTDNNGVTDIYGFGGDLTMILKEFLASNNAILVKEDGTEGLTDPKTLEVFQFLNKLYNEDKVGRPISGDWNDNINAWTQSKVVFSPTPMWVLQGAGEVNFTYRIAPWPVGPSGDGTKAGQAFGDYFAIPKGVKDPDKVYQVIEEFFGGWFGGNDLDTRDIDMVELAEGCFRDESDVDTAFKIGEMGNGDIWTIIDTGYLVNGVFGSVVTAQEMTPAQAVEANKQLFQDQIDKILKK